ncbi:MAG: YdeI/OmpD-associated family protein [Actinomycetes bacterium]
MNPEVDDLVARATKWPQEMVAMRSVLLGTGLAEEVKWRQPCYTHDGRNIVIMGEMGAGLTLGFFKGELLDDPDGVLVDNGPNSRSARRLFVTSVAEVERMAPKVRQLVENAVAVEEAGLTVGPAPEPELVAELVAELDADPALRAAFDALTPGRRRAYNIYFGDAKQSATRTNRVRRHVPRIMAGKGLQDR